MRREATEEGGEISGGKEERGGRGPRRRRHENADGKTVRRRERGYERGSPNEFKYLNYKSRGRSHSWRRRVRRRST